MLLARVAIVLIGISLPYLARIPGMVSHGPDWLTSYFGSGLGAVLFFGAFNAINWIPVAVGTLAFRSLTAVIVSASIGFAWPAYAHATLDLASDAQAALGLIFIPIYSLPLVLVGWVLAFAVDSKRRRRDVGAILSRGITE